MSRYDVETTVEYDGDDLITRGGVAWAERRPVAEQLVLMTAVIAMFAVVAGLIWLLAAETMNPLLGFGAPVLLASVLMVFQMPGEARALFFLPDGSMKTPHGIFYRPGISEITGHHSHLVSIEARVQRQQPTQDSHLFEIILLSAGGDLICMSRNLPEWAALKIAAQLTHLLSRMRAEHAGMPSAAMHVELS